MYMLQHEMITEALKYLLPICSPSLAYISLLIDNLVLFSASEMYKHTAKCHFSGLPDLAGCFLDCAADFCRPNDLSDVSQTMSVH